MEFDRQPDADRIAVLIGCRDSGQESVWVSLTLHNEGKRYAHRPVDQWPKRVDAICGKAAAMTRCEPGTVK